MSIVHCNHCNKDIDTDFDAEHFVPDTEHCLIQVEEAAPDMLKALKRIAKFEGSLSAVVANEAIKKATDE